MRKSFATLGIGILLISCASTQTRLSTPPQTGWEYGKTTSCDAYKGQASFLLNSSNWNGAYKHLRMAISESTHSRNRTCYVGAIAFYIKFNRKFNFDQNLSRFEKIYSSFNSKDKEIIKNDPDILRSSQILNAPKWP